MDREEGSVQFGRIKVDEPNAVSFPSGGRNFANAISYFLRAGTLVVTKGKSWSVGRMQLVVKFGGSGPKLLSRFVAEVN